MDEEAGAGGWQETTPRDPEFDTWAQAWAYAMNMGTRGAIDVTDATFDRTAELVADTAWWDSLYGLIGKTIHRTSFVETLLAPLVTYLLNPDRQQDMVVAVSRLSSSNRLDMLSGLLHPDWSDGKVLIRHLKTMLQERNKLAHGTFLPMQFKDDGSLLEGMFLTSFVNRSGVYTEEEKLYTRDDFGKLATRIAILQSVLSDLLSHFVLIHLNKVPFNPDMHLLSMSFRLALNRAAAKDLGDKALADSLDPDYWEEFAAMFPVGLVDLTD